MVTAKSNGSWRLQTKQEIIYLISMGHFNWKGEWISEESPFEKAGEYSLKQDLIKELLAVARKYQGIIKDKTIAEAANEVVKKFRSLK
jgi:hypothetical protein